MSSDGKISLDYSGEMNEIIRGLLRRRQVCQSQSRRYDRSRGACVCGCKREREIPLQAGKGTERNSPAQPP